MSSARRSLSPIGPTTSSADMSCPEPTPAKHSHLLPDKDCTGPLQRRALAHRYETDILEISSTPSPRPPHPKTSGGRPSTPCSKAYPNGCRSAETRSTAPCTRHQEDTPHWSSSTRSPAAPAAPSASSVRSDVLEAALARVAGCDCGEETSCYGCLRGYRNQSFHEELRRGVAVDFLGSLVPVAERPPGGVR
jgi:hypothetical protein